MPINHLSFKKTHYFSDLICDYLDQNKHLKPLYNRFPTLENFEHQIKEKEKSFCSKTHSNTRKTLVNTLYKQYSGIEISKLTDTHIKSLKHSNAYTITTGHQLNLFTGPLYFLYKIVSTINLTKLVKSKYPNYNFVPVFWMATEDHDFEEINFFNFKRKKVCWHSDQSGAVGRFSTKSLKAVYDVISNEFGHSQHAKRLKDIFKTAYLEYNTLADATRYLVNTLFGDFGLVILDADDRALKSLFIPYIEKDIFEKTAFDKVSETNTYIKNQGLKTQVHPRKVNFFYLSKGLRERVVFEDGLYKVNRTAISWTREGLKSEIKNHPQHFSPNVILRPLYQEVILPNLCYVGGAGELAYWLQLKSTFQAHGVSFPMLSLRNSALLKTKQQSKKQTNLKISDSDLFLKRNTFINKRVRTISNINIDFSDQMAHLQSQFSALYNIAEQTDKSFLGAVKAQEAKQIKGLKHLEKRLLKAQKKKLVDEITRCTDLQEQLFPNQTLQERHLNFSELYLDYGDDLIEILFKKLQPLQNQFLITTL